MELKEPKAVVIIVGGGQAGYQVALSLRENAYRGRILLMCTESHLPYQQPPLSKDFLIGKMEEERLGFRSVKFYEEKKIEVLLAEEATSIDRHKMTVTTTKNVYSYNKLILATGSRPRRLPVRGTDLVGITTLRTLDDACLLRTSLRETEKLAIIGAGFTGLEVAAAALSQGLEVTLVEAASRVMSRAVSPEISSFFERVHCEKGLDLRLETSLSYFSGDRGRVRAVVLKDGTRLDCDRVLLSIGVVPNQFLAQQAGLNVADGIVVNAYMQTSNEHIYAVGDCAFHPNPFWRGMFRLESVQNAIDQAKTAAAHIVGSPVAYQAVPWFWSVQQGFKLQMTGLPKADAESVSFGDPDRGAFGVLRFEDNYLTGVETVNEAGEHVASRRLLSKPGRSIAKADIVLAGSPRAFLKQGHL